MSVQARIMADADSFEVFIRERVYLDYAKEFLYPEQIDEIDESLIPGYAGQVSDVACQRLRR